MKRMAIVVGVCALLAGGLVEVSEAQSEAHCIVRIEADSSVLPQTEQMIDLLLRSAPIAGEALRELGSESRPLEDVIDVSFTRIISPQSHVDSRGRPLREARQVLVGQIRVVSDLESANSEALLKKICEHLATSLTQTADAVRASLEVQLERIDAELASVQAEQSDLRAQRQKLLDEAGRADLTRERLEDEIASYENEKRDLRFEYESMIARERALTEQIAKIGKTVEEKSVGNEAVAEMEKALALRSQKLEYAKRLLETGQMSAGEVSEIEAELAEQRVQLIRLRENVARQMGGNVIERLNMELIELGINGAELEAKLGAVESALKRIRDGKLMMLAERYECEIAAEVTELVRTAHTLMTEQRDLRTTLRLLQPPSVVIIGE